MTMIAICFLMTSVTGVMIYHAVKMEKEIDDLSKSAAKYLDLASKRFE